jgi:tetratricopeptide (TPR) repeat protein
MKEGARMTTTWGTLAGNVNGTLVMSRQSLAKLAAAGQTSDSSPSNPAALPSVKPADDDRTLVMRRSLPSLPAQEEFPSQTGSGSQPGGVSQSDLHGVYEPPHTAPEPKKTPPSVMVLNKFIVSAYKAAGFTILTAILVGLGAYIVVNLFYLGNRSWMAPTIISPTDPKVLQLNSEAVHEQAQKDQVAATRRDLYSKLLDAQATLRMEQQFQDQFREAMKADIADRKSELAKFQGAAGQYYQAKGQIDQSNQAYSALSKERMDELQKAHLIDQDGIINGNYQLAQIATTNVSLAERNVELDTKISEIRREIDSLNNAVNESNGGAKGGVFAYSILKEKRDYDQSLVNAEKAKADSDALSASISAIDETTSRYDDLIGAIQNSPYIKALTHDMNVAFVPYENAKNVHKGDPIYGCKAGILWCKKVGKVGEILDGEVLGKHPLHNQDIRGEFVQMELDDPTWARETVLHVGRAPLFI